MSVLLYNPTLFGSVAVPPQHLQLGQLVAPCKEHGSVPKRLCIIASNNGMHDGTKPPSTIFKRTNEINWLAQFGDG
jgi:hypothetical protein